MSDITNMIYDELPENANKQLSDIKNMNLIYNVPIKLKAKLGSTMKTVEEILQFDTDVVVELDTNVGELVELYANDTLIGYGEIVVVNDDIGIKVARIITDSIDEKLIK